MKQVLEFLKTSEFFQKLLLLLITAALTGVLVPEVAGRLAERRFEQQKRFEEDLARQRDILAAQSKLLEDLSTLLWKFCLMNLDVSFYKDVENEPAYREAVERYQSEAAAVLGQIRTGLSESRRLVSPQMQERLKSLYLDTLIPMDRDLEQLIERADTAQKEEWHQQFEASFGTAQEQIDDALAELAAELKLTAREADPHGILTSGSAPGSGAER